MMSAQYMAVAHEQILLRSLGNIKLENVDLFHSAPSAPVVNSGAWKSRVATPSALRHSKSRLAYAMMPRHFLLSDWPLIPATRARHRPLIMQHGRKY